MTPYVAIVVGAKRDKEYGALSWRCLNATRDPVNLQRELAKRDAGFSDGVWIGDSFDADGGPPVIRSLLDKEHPWVGAIVAVSSDLAFRFKCDCLESTCEISRSGEYGLDGVYDAAIVRAIGQWSRFRDHCQNTIGFDPGLPKLLLVAGIFDDVADDHD